ncbi:MAG TPA: hypothetical protein VH416_00520 [Gaiellaceae bacterium]|jgi:hypothetical protein
MDEMQMRQVQAETFAEDDRDHVAIYTTTLEARSELSRELLVDPLPLLVENLPEVTPDWTVSIERVNAESALKGPRKLICVFVLFPTLERVQAFLLRVAESDL